jgi:hypothetical protein
MFLVATVGVGMLISAFQILQHLFNYYNSKIQKYVVRLLLMVPIYLGFCLGSFVFEKEFKELKIIRDCYEGFVVYSFLQLVNQYIGTCYCIMD